jgi:hypothetical protein
MKRQQILLMVLLVTFTATNDAANAGGNGAAGEQYRARFFLSGMLLRASAVCGGNWKSSASVAIELIATPEMKAVSAAYPETTKNWSMEGAENFNTGVMQDGIGPACRYAEQMRKKAKLIK